MPQQPEIVSPPVPRASEEDLRLVRRLRAGDEAAFMELVDRYHSSLVRLARTFVSSQAVAEDVAQEAWVGVLRGIDRFEGRSSLRTWIYRILTNTAKTRAVREARSVPFASLGGDGEEGAVDADRFLPAGDEWAGHWVSVPQTWSDQPENRLLGDETQAVITDAIDRLPPRQAAVIRLRDVDGFSSAEVCDLLEISEANQRVLLHRARSKVRAALEDYLEEGGMSDPEITCRELVELVTDYLEGALDPGTLRLVEEHLAGCPGCTAYLDEMRVTIRLTGGLTEGDIDPGVRGSLVHAFRDARGGLT